MAIEKMTVKGIDVRYSRVNQNDYISLTDIAQFKNPAAPKDVVKNWLRNKDTIAFLGLWETLNNPDFKGVEFDSFKNEAGYNAFTLSPEQWIEKTGAIGITTSGWRTKNPGKKGNMRDYASVEQLLVLANLESYNAILLEQELPQAERIVLLNKTARKQLETLMSALIKNDTLLALPMGKGRNKKRL